MGSHCGIFTNRIPVENGTCELDDANSSSNAYLIADSLFGEYGFKTIEEMDYNFSVPGEIKKQHFPN
ncbi:hypothetical protein GCM10011361_24860 [Muriicola marianensis]|uniref:Uncharacterized protein n=1 Tax=Muriicola marianensis TaxID=1324801 RepID=A0ABQ1R646_9FLAO|nr:hypothetical protein GCM10011361_24860 [Muriicola marianensis]